MQHTDKVLTFKEKKKIDYKMARIGKLSHSFPETNDGTVTGKIMLGRFLVKDVRQICKI